MRGHDLGQPQRVIQIEGQVGAVDREAERRAIHPGKDRGQLPHGEIGMVLHGNLHAQVFRGAAGLAENGHGLVGQGDHIVPFIADEEIARHAAKNRRAELLGDVQVLDDDCASETDVS